jgi:hypothetical protein
MAAGRKYAVNQVGGKHPQDHQSHGNGCGLKMRKAQERNGPIRHGDKIHNITASLSC